jgi:hypothetical protein
VEDSLAEGGLEVAAVVALVADQRLAGQQSGQSSVVEDRQQHLPFVGLGASERPQPATARTKPDFHAPRPSLKMYG